MQKNAFEKVSSLSVIATRKDGKTILQDVRFTAPYKIMQPFIQKDGGIQIMLLSASAGIMEGCLLYTSSLSIWDHSELNLSRQTTVLQTLLLWRFILRREQ